jgi:hypothetical protein
VDAYGATQKAAVAGLELFINLVLHDHGFWIGGLGCVPVGFGAIQLGGQRGVELIVLRPLP